MNKCEILTINLTVLPVIIKGGPQVVWGGFPLISSEVLSAN